MRKFFTLLMLCWAFQISQAQCPQSLSIDTSICSGAVNVTADARVLKTKLCGDSITILFNATGTPLAGDTNVYFHSGPEFRPFAGWALPYTVGHYGVNDGVGRMTSLGNNLWSIRINPRTYYGYSADSCLNGIFMVFRNFNGNLQAKDNGNDIYLYTAPGTPTSTYAPIQGSTETHNNAVTYSWSDGHTDSVRVFTSGGTYTVTATGVGGCSSVGKVKIRVAHAPVSLGSDVVRCNPNTVTTLNAGTGFVSYKWLNNNATASATYSARNPGCYWVTATDSAGCVSTSSISVENSEVTGLLLPDSLGTCPGGHLSADASVNINKYGDSIVIIYNAAVGQTGLVGASKVYMHSGPEFHPFQGWVGSYTVGNYGQDDGVGQMTSLGNNKWRIAIDPYCYYKINPDTNLNGLWMIFRNADGTQTGKDSSGGNIFVYTAVTPPTCSFTGVTPSRTARGPLTYNWSNGVTTSAINFTTAGNYRLTVSDNSGCSVTDSIKVSFNSSFAVNLGADTTICRGTSVVLTGPANLAHYAWSNAATTQNITVNTTGVYTLTATDTSGCQASDSRSVTVSTSQVNVGPDIVSCTRVPVTINANAGFRTYQWLNAPAGSNTSYVGRNPGPYWIKAVDSAGCASYDTMYLHYSNVLGLSIPDTLSTCPGGIVAVNANTSIEQNGDSLVIIYDATTGQTGLTNAHSVYMHSGPEFYAGQGWVLSHTVGNWGQNDGVGKMDSLGNNHWRIAIDLHSYYHVNPDTAITGVYMVFRNADGSQTGKDGNGGNIYVALTGATPVSQFFGVYAFKASSGNITYSWSNGATAASTTFNTAGLYTLTVSDSHTCTATASVRVLFINNLSISLGNDTTICQGRSLTLTPGAGYGHYHWSTGDTTATITASVTGAYSVTVTNGTCSATSTINVTVRNHPISLGNDIVRCNTSPVTLSATSGFTSYHWFGGATTGNTYSAANEGTYWVQGIDANGCSSYDTVTVTNSSVLGLLINDSTLSCGPDTVRLDASTNINATGDSLTIVYDATKGQSGLVGAAKVYFHSGPQFYAGGGWQGNYTVGTWGVDNGVGQMKSLGNNKWTITIDPRNYYHVHPDTPILGIYMVFRNADGTQTGKDNSGNNIQLNLTGAAPTSTFAGITGTRKAALPLTYNWTGGATTAATYFTANGTYSVTVADTNGCSKTASTVIVQGTSASINLGRDTSICTDSILMLNAGNGFTNYVWNTGASTPFLYVSTPGTYSVTVTNNLGCTGKDSIVVSSGTPPVINLGHDTSDCSPVVLNAGSGFAGYHWNNGSSTSSITVTTPGTYTVTVTSAIGCKAISSVIVDSCHSVIVVGCGSPIANFGVLSITPGNTVTYKDSSHIAKTFGYVWNFGDGTSSDSTGSIVHTYSNPGTYHVTLIVRDSCGGVDSITKVVNVNVTGIQTIEGLTAINLYPNPANGAFTIDLTLQQAQTLEFTLLNQLGEAVISKKSELSAGRNMIQLNGSDLAAGVYILELSNNNQRTIKKLTITR